MIDALHDAIRKACAAPQWSAGVKLARAEAVVGEQADEDELELRVIQKGQRNTTFHEVSLYPHDEEWDCSCPSKASACEHVAAAVIAARQAQEEHGGSDGSWALPTGAQPIGHVRYRLVRGEQGLSVERDAVLDERTEPLTRSLTRAAAGREEPAPVPVERPDLDVEEALGALPPMRVPRDRMPALLRALAGCREVLLDGEFVRVSARPALPRAVVEEDGDGFRLFLEPDPAVDEVFPNGAVRAGDVVQPVGDGGLPRDRMRALAQRTRFRPDEPGTAGRAEGDGAERSVSELVADWLPELRRKLPVEVRTDRLPGLVPEPPRLVVDTSRRDDDRLEVRGEIVYGDPVAARVVDGELHVVGHGVPVRDEAAEEELAGRLRRELGLIPGQPAVLDGEEAVSFAERLRAWRDDDERTVAGEAHEGFTLAPPLVPKVEMEGEALDVRFEAEAGGDGDENDGTGGDGAGTAGRADPERVLRAWERGATLAPLDDGGWAPLPSDWLRQHGQLVADLLDARDDEDGTLPRCAQPDLAKLCDALEHPRPPDPSGLQNLAEGFEGIPRAELPADLTATLRSYQQQAVDWLAFLREAGLGGLLADDMGLGKTLQALTVVRGRTLVVAPTSVLPTWKAEAERFRPALRVCLYHGPKRELDPEADLVVTSYALLRLDADRLTAEEWDTAILDEAQAIKNPDSRVSRAAYRVRAGFRLTLTGTPVENRLEELWSQMHFLNPGLLGGRERFRERYAKPIADGQPGAASRLRDRIRPFVLRRLKREVERELPPRIEVTLHVELDEEERAAYDAIRAATRKEVVERLRGGAGALEALEALTRLRQAACDPALLPGREGHEGPASKTRQLLDNLDEAVSEGHKALVFSQWTSHLDRLEPALREAGLDYVRLDGSTRNRGAVVERFQDEGGPPVMLISLTAGGTGLNLTAADHVFLMDPWWNPAVEDQAADRAHRIGQEHPVLVHRVVARGTVEERILSLQESKRQLADAALGEADQATSLSRDDLMQLLD